MYVTLFILWNSMTLTSFVFAELANTMKYGGGGGSYITLFSPSSRSKRFLVTSLRFYATVVSWAHSYKNILLFSRFAVFFRLLIAPIPANTKHLHSICTTSAQRLRRWSNIVQMLYKCVVFTGIKPPYCTAKANINCFEYVAAGFSSEKLWLFAW